MYVTCGKLLLHIYDQVLWFYDNCRTLAPIENIRKLDFLMFSGKSKGSLERNKYSLQKYPLSKNYYPKFNNFLLYLSPFSFLVKEYPESMFIQLFQYGTKAALDNEKVHMYMLCIFCFFLLYYCSKVKTTFQLKVFAKYSVENHLFKLCDRLL